MWGFCKGKLAKNEPKIGKFKNLVITIISFYHHPIDTRLTCLTYILQDRFRDTPLDLVVPKKRAPNTVFGVFGHI